ncbi:MAG: hypothetical protein FWE61_05685 [Micrococcales bacterium]|nr:hypothetical protein [Micrococcales bacterium]
MHHEVEVARSRFSPDELRELDALRTVTPWRREPDALVLALGWADEVDRFDRERTLPASNNSVRTEHDFIGALFYRDMAEDAIRALPERLALKVRPYLETGDQLFLKFTVPDSGASVAVLGNTDVAGRGWWWFRLPIDGPVAEVIRAWGARYWSS